MTTTDKPCLEGCYGGTDHDEQRTYVVHAPGCPNAPKEPASFPPCETCGAPLAGDVLHLHLSAPTPEPLKPPLEAMKSEAEAMVKKAFADIREKEALRAENTKAYERIEEQADDLAALRAEVERLKGIIMGTDAESRVTLAANLRRYWPAEAQVMLGRMLFDEDVLALRAELAEARAEIGNMGKEKAAQALKISRYRIAVRNCNKTIRDRRLTLRNQRYQELLTIVEALTFKIGSMLGEAKPFAWFRFKERDDYFTHRDIRADRDALLNQLAAEKAAREKAEEKERMVDASISVLSMSNTRDTLRGNKLPRENPYWTPAQDDVEKAVLREIEHREAREKAEAQVRILEVAADRVVKHRNKHYRDVRETVDTLERILASAKGGAK